MKISICFLGVVFIAMSSGYVGNEIQASVFLKKYNFTLSVYGNANGDDSLNKDDIKYVQGVISGKYKPSQYADANVDDQIDYKDVKHIKDIIDNRPIAITLVDNAGVTVTVNAPAKRPAVMFFGPMRPVLHLQGADGIVGVGSRMLLKGFKWPAFHAYPQLRKLPELGSTNDPNQESILLTAPDLILGTRHTNVEVSKIVSKNTGIPFMYGNPDGTMFSSDNGAYETWRLLSLILGQKEKKRAEELIHYCETRIHEVQNTVTKIPPQNRVKVILLAYSTSEDLFKVATGYEPIDLAGGDNAARELDKVSSWWRAVEVSPEQIISWNPDVILFHSYSKSINFIAKEDILSNPVLRNVNAIKNKSVYGTKAWSAGWDPATALTEVFYMAKLFYPERFKNLNVEAKGNDILEKFYKTAHLYTWIIKNCGNYQTWPKQHE